MAGLQGSSSDYWVRNGVFSSGESLHILPCHAFGNTCFERLILKFTSIPWLHIRHEEGTSVLPSSKASAG